jgi:hypothetical protein
MRELNSDVTLAVIHAETALKDAIRNYDELIRAEHNIAGCSFASDEEREIARSGVRNAKRILNLLRQAWPE